MSGNKILTGSFFNKIGGRIAEFFYDKANTSALSAYLNTDSSLHNLKEGSAFAALFAMLGAKSAASKKKFASLVEESVLMAKLKAFFLYLMSLSLMSWGIGCVVYAFTVSAVTVIRALAAGQLGNLNIAINAVYSASFLFMGILMMTYKHSLYQSVRRSFILSRLLFNVAGIRNEQLAVNKTVHSPLIPCLLAVLSAAFAWFVPAHYVPLAFIALIAAVLVLNMPEFGMILLLFTLPFLSTKLMLLVSMLVIFAFAFKLFRGKRSVTFDKLDVAVLMFLIVMLLLGCATSLNPIKSLYPTMLYAIFLLVYFVAANTMRSKSWAMRAIIAGVASGTISAIVGVYQYFSGFRNSLVWVDTSMFSDITARVIGTFENPNVFGEFLILLIPVAFALLIGKKTGGRYEWIVSIFFMGLALVYTYSRGAWLAFILAFGLYLLIINKVFIKLATLCLLAVPFLPAVLPHSVVGRISSIGNMSDTSTAYRVNIWVGTLRMLKHFWVTGIGTGTDIFTQVYPAYALSGAAYALHPHNLFLNIIVEMGFLGFICFLFILVFYFKRVLGSRFDIDDVDTKNMITALGVGMLAYVLQGLTDNVWYNYRIFLMFWTILGLTVGLYRGYLLEWGRAEDQE
ncbi:MAG: O-antigen ligase family protein [Bacillota bacterium]|nr:O-antigen ligase family protein [Bacillota bacterium]